MALLDLGLQLLVLEFHLVILVLILVYLIVEFSFLPIDSILSLSGLV